MYFRSVDVSNLSAFLVADFSSFFQIQKFEIFCFLPQGCGARSGAPSFQRKAGDNSDR